MSITALQQQLSTPGGFATVVKAKSATLSGGITCLVVGAGGIAINLFQLGTASDWNWRLISRYFLDASIVEFSGSGAAKAAFWRYLYVYAPLILIPLGIILLIVHFTSRRKNGAALFADFQARGWVGRQRLTGLSGQNGRTEIPIALISHPSVPDPSFEQLAQQYAAQVQSLDKKGRKAAVTAATKAGVLRGASAAVLSQGLPAALVAAPVQGKGEFVAVIPPDAAGKAFRILPITA